MNRNISVLTMLLVVSALLTGCTTIKTKPLEPQPAKIEPVETTIEQPGGPQISEQKQPEPEQNPATFFHDKFADILRDFVNDQGLVNYNSLKLKRTELKQLLNECDELKKDQYSQWSDKDKIAFWINVYNMNTLSIILDNYPIKAPRVLSIIWGPYSIRHINKQIGGIKSQKFTVMDEIFTLTEIERRFFREKFNEPKVFFALSQGCSSGPPLRNEPYYGHQLNEQLDDQIRKFLTNELALRIDRAKQTVYLSPMFKSDWYGTEFIEKYVTEKKFKDQPLSVRAVLNLITKYVSKHDVNFLELESYTVKYINYNWTINEYPKPGT
ncbi:MAG: DUF547 domain-containing protein [Sedimentisphaerales bacterium]|nr:DUF547 domain-containing protein [Sedimentisphaerales bacterium]